MRDLEPTADDLRHLFQQKFGDPQATGWGPRIRLRYGYFSPDDHYEALVSRLVTAQTRWLDVGSGRHLFPSNPHLARELAARCARLVGADPDATIEENPYVHASHRVPIEELSLKERFDLVTLRMVAEHLAEPARALAAIASVTEPGGHVVIYTVHRWSPVPLIAAAVPEALQNPIKRLFWDVEAKDTFPVRYRMNTRRRLQALAAEAGFREALFLRLDDCRSLGRFRLTQLAELTLWRGLRAVGLSYPEHCLLGVYERSTAATR